MWCESGTLTFGVLIRDHGRQGDWISRGFLWEVKGAMRIRAILPLIAVGSVVLLGLGCAHKQKLAGASAPLKVGAVISINQPTAIAELSRAPESYVGQTVRIEGTVSRVCQGMGCWAEVKASDGSTFLARSLDESVLLPKDCVGRRIVVEGVVTALPSKAAAEPIPEGHECPRPDYLVATQGVELY